MTVLLLHSRRARGQALAEFVVVALALVPLFLLIPVIAKYQDIAHATQMASRYVAFESAARNDGMSNWEAPDQLAAEARRRFFSNADAPIRTNDSAANVDAQRNLFWVDPQGNALIADFNSDVKISFGANNGAAQTDGFEGASDGTPFTLRSQLGLEARGIYTANVSVSLRNLPAGIKSYEPFDQINLAINRHTSLAPDSWTASGPEKIDERLDSAVLFPGRTLRAVKPLTDAANGIVEFPKYYPNVCLTCGPKLGGLEFWHDAVPGDRLRRP